VRTRNSRWCRPTGRPVHKVLAAGCVFLMVSGRALPLLAEPTPAELTEARALFAEATALEATGDYAGAEAKLVAALAIKETPGLRYHLAHCEEQRGAFMAANANYERASTLIQAGAAAPDVEPLLPLAARRLDSRVARLEIVVPVEARASAELDGVELPPSSIGATVKVDPGPHRLRVRSPGQADFNADLTFVSGERRTIKVFFAASTGPLPAAPVATAASPRSTANGGIGGRGVVLLGEAALTLTGVGFGLGFLVARATAAERVEHAQAAVDQQAPGTSGCGAVPAPPACADLEQALDDHSRASTLATASFVGAGVAASALVLTWALWPSSPRAVSLALRPSSAGVELAATGAF